MTFLPTNNGDLLGYRPSRPAALSGLLGYDGKTAARKSLGAALMMAGAKIASAPRGNIVGPAILGLAEGANYGEDSYRKSVRDQFEISQLQREAEQQQRQDEFAKRVGLLGGGAGEPLSYNVGMTRQTGAASPTAGASGSGASLGSFSDPALLPDFLAAYPDQAGSIYADILKPKDPMRVNAGDTLLDPYTYQPLYSVPDNKPPALQDFYGPGNTMTKKQWNESTQSWEPVGPAVPRWQPQQQPQTVGLVTVKMPDGTTKSFVNTDRAGVAAAVQAGGVATSDSSGPTLAQMANNREIAGARALLPKDLTAETIRLKTTKADEWGQPNPSYDPQFAKLISIASQRMVGEDPGYDDLMGRLYGAPAPAGDGLPTTLQSNPAPPADDSQTSPSQASSLPRDATGQIDAKRLRVGSLYDGGDGVYRWTGFGFEQVQ